MDTNLRVDPTKSTPRPPAERKEIYLKVIDPELIQRILASCNPEFGSSNILLEVPKGWEDFQQHFPPGALAEETSLPESFKRVAFPIDSFNTTNHNTITASGQGSLAAHSVHIYMLGNNLFKKEDVAPPQEKSADPKEVKKALVELYSSESFKTIKRLIDPTKSISISKSFVRLAVLLEQTFEKKQKESLEGKNEKEKQDTDFVCLNSHEAIVRPKELIEVGNLFEHSDLDGLTPSRLLATGAAGIGKSTLCQYLANTWAEYPKKLGNWGKKFDYLFLIRLRDLTTCQSIPTLAEAVQKSLRKLCLETIEKILVTEKDKVLFLFDGYDEIASWLGRNEERNAFFKHLLEQPHWILTTRPNYFNEPMGSYNCRQLEIIGFTRKDVKSYVDQFFADSGCQQKASGVHQLLNSNARIAALSHIPINLELLCSVWKIKTTTSTQPYTMTKLYGEISGFLFRRYIKDRLGGNSQGITLNFISGNEHYRPFLQAIETIAWKGLRSHTASLIIDREIYEPVLGAILNSSETPASLKTNFYSALFNDLGIFRSVPSFENNENPDLANYYFIHLTSQEYFAASYFIRKFFHPGVQGEEWKEHLNEMKFNPKFGVVLWFVAGLLGEKVHDCSESRTAAREAKGALDAFIKCLISPPRSLLGSHELALAMHCSEELEGVTIPSQHQALEEFIEQLQNLVKGKSRSHRIKSCATLFQGVRKFYLLDTAQSILQTIQQKGLDKAIDVMSAFQLLAPGIVDFLIKIMKDKRENSYFRSRAAILLVEFHLEEETLAEVAEVLIQRLSDEDRNARIEAAELLGHLQLGGETLANVVEALIQRLGDKDDYILRGVVRLFGKLQIEGQAFRLDGKKSSVRIEAAKSLVKLQLQGETLAKVVEAFIHRLGDENSDVLSSAAESLGNLQIDGETLAKVAEALIHRLGDENSDVLSSAAESLGNLQIDGETLAKVAEALIHRLGDENSDVRRSAAESLSNLQLGGETRAKVAEALIHRLGDENSDVRRSAAESLSNLQLEGETRAKVAEALIHRLDNEKSSVRKNAAESLVKFQLEGEILEKVAEALIHRLGDENSDVRRSAAESLSNLQLEGEILEKVAEALIHRLGDENSDVRRSAAESLSNLQLEGETRAKVAEALIHRLGDENSDVRRSAAESLSNLQLEGETRAKVAEALIHRLDNEKSSVRKNAAESLVKFQLEGEILEKVAEALIRRLNDEKSSVRTVAAKSLGKLQLEVETIAKVVKALIQRLGDEDIYVRMNAARSLAELQLAGESLAKVVEALIEILGDYYIGTSAYDFLAKFQLEGETLAKVAERLIQIIEDEYHWLQGNASESFQTLVDIKKIYVQMRSNKETAIKLIAYKIFLSETLCYYQEGCFYYYDHGRISEPIEMDENDYRKLERFMKTELLAISES